MEKRNKQYIALPSHKKLFKFTEMEEWQMERHKLNAAKFMENYGKGEQPYVTGCPISRRKSCTSAR